MTASTSFATTGRSKPPKNVLELGKHLVQELGLESSNNTLGRWIAHHVAELMSELKDAKNDRIRKDLERRVVDLILKLWTMRDVLPADANPLKRYEEVLKGIRQLRPEENPWQRLRGSQRQQVAATLYQNLTRLTIGILLLDLPADSGSIDSKAARVAAFLSPVENQVVLELKRVLLEVGLPVVPVQARSVSHKPDQINVPSRIRELIDEARKTLSELEKLLPEHQRREGSSHLPEQKGVVSESLGPKRPSAKLTSKKTLSPVRANRS